jgi:uncharacterized membrane protein
VETAPMTTRFLLSFALVVSIACAARAQETGGSFDSEDWGSSSDSEGSSDWGSGSGSSDWGSQPSTPSTDYGSTSDWGSGSGGGTSSDYGSTGSSYPRTDYDTSPTTSYTPAVSGDAVGFFFVIVLVLIVLAIIVFVAQLPGRREVSPRSYGRDYLRVVGPPASPGLVDVSMLQLAIDWRARKFVQGELAKLAREGDTASKEGRVRLLRATTSALSSVKLAWLYAGARNFRPMVQAQAQTEFQRIANDVRASFRQEIVRASAGRVVSIEAVGVRAKEHEGAGVVLVSVIVAARREIFDVDANRAASIERLLGSLQSLSANEVLALSVVWTPAAEEDRMSTDELEARNRHLVRLGDIGGRVFCRYCAGPHAEELATCPHCGAPTGTPAAAGG